MTKAESCRRWRESLGAYALDRLEAGERAGVEAHLEGCAECRAELASLTSIATLLPLADPARFDTAPAPPSGLGDRIAAAVAAEHKTARRRRRRIGFTLGAATAAVAAALLAFVVLPGGGGEGPEQHVSFASLPPGMKIGATLKPHSFGTEIHVYVKGVRSGTLCRVSLRRPDGTTLSAGSFRYRWDEDDSAVLSSALDLSNTAAIAIRVGGRTFVAPVDGPPGGGSPSASAGDVAVRALTSRPPRAEETT
jgi:predicted anti-sigma-YlaC factor YlaD